MKIHRPNLTVLRRWRAIVALGVTALGLSLALLVYEGPRYYGAPGRAPASRVACPFQVSESVRAALDSNEPGEWTIYRYDGATPAPTIAVTSVRIDGVAYCSLHVESASSRPRGGSDWRIGYTLPHGLRGRRLRLTLRIFATVPMETDTGVVYFHDGPSGTQVALRRVDTEPREITVTHTVSNDATTLEVWLRLVLDKGTIKPVGASLRFAASLAEAPP